MPRASSSVRMLSAVVIAAALSATGCGGEAGPSALSQVEEITADAERPLDRLEEALAEARPRSRSSMVDLRAAARRAADELDDAQDDLRDVEATGDDRQLVRQAEDAVEELSTLAGALGASTPSVSRIEQAAAQARLAVDDLEDVSLPEVDTEEFVAALRADRRRRSADDARTGRPSEPVGPSSGGSSASASEPGYTDYVGPAFQARLPTGSGWGAPAQSEPTPGRLYRTSVRGPGGLFVIVDYTPFEPARFGGDYQSRETVGQTAFGSATKYVFQGGRLPECQRSPCVDYIINDASSGEGFAVLAGGSSTATASAIARTVAESVTPVG